MFTAAALALVVGTALLMTQVGLSPALGTFLAGVVLATSEYRHELEGDIEPFKGLLLGLFFISVGATVDFGLVAERPLLVLGLVAGVVLLKLVTLAGLLAAANRFFGLSLDQRLLVAFALAQVGEFAFVLFSFAERERVLTAAETAPLVAAVALSMALTPLVLLAYERVVRPRIGTREAPAPSGRPTRSTSRARRSWSGSESSGRRWGGSCAPTGCRPRCSTSTRTASRCCARWASRCTTATRRASSCSRRRARGGRGCS
jgi:predicted Kef-type K+ transport protein